MKIKIGFAKPKGFSIKSLLYRLTERVEFSTMFLELEKTDYNSSIIYVDDMQSLKLMGNKGFSDNYKTINTYQVYIKDEVWKYVTDYVLVNSERHGSFTTLLSYAKMRLLRLFKKDNLISSECNYSQSELIERLIPGLLSSRTNQDYKLVKPLDVQKAVSSINNARYDK